MFSDFLGDSELLEQQIEQYLTLDTLDVSVKHAKVLCIIFVIENNIGNSDIYCLIEINFGEKNKKD